MNNETSTSETNDSSFDSLYINIRKKEGRLLSDEEVKLLPFLASSNKHAKEWNIRAKSMQRFQKYLNASNINALLEIGCGNGWFSHQCSKHTEQVVGIDINPIELKQAQRLFQHDNLHFYEWNLFTKPPFDMQFDCIVLNAVIQYFPDFHALVNRLQELLNQQGEIHIIDSPFYSKDKVDAARNRSLAYYSQMGVPQMADHYFHHDFDNVKGFDVLYQPSSNKISNWFARKDSPFSWYRLKVN